MGRYWALQLASFVFRFAGVLVLAYAFIQLVYPVADWKNGSVDIQFFPHPLLVYQSLDNSESVMATIPISRLLHGFFYSLALYAIGQTFAAIFEMKRESEIVYRAIMSRARRSQELPADKTVELDWRADSPPQSDTMGYSRRYRPEAPQVPPDDPRRPRMYSKREITTHAPDSRLPRPKSKG